MRKVLILGIIILAVAATCYFLSGTTWIKIYEIENVEDEKSPEAESIEQGMNIFQDDFSQSENVEEEGDPDHSESDVWWVNSGAFLIKEGGTGKTLFRELREGSQWQKKYQNHNSNETDKGTRPQNIFRLISKSKWENFIQEAYFNIDDYHLSKDEHRYESNGILLFNRYLDSDNLYYAGIRVDGNAVVKKKVNGEYYTMAIKKIYEGDYDRESNPNLLPINQWIGIRTEVETLSEGAIGIKLFLDKEHNGEWEFLLEVVDDGKEFGGKAITQAGYAGIRTDFMDVEFDDYKIEEIKE